MYSKIFQALILNMWLTNKFLRYKHWQREKHVAYNSTNSFKHTESYINAYMWAFMFPNTIHINSNYLQFSIIGRSFNQYLIYQEKLI